MNSISDVNNLVNDVLAEHKFWRMVKWLRWLLLPYFLVVAVTGLFAIAIMSYGFAHASAGSAGQFFAFLLGVMAIAAIAPLSFLSNRRSWWMRLLQLIGLAVFSLVLAVFAWFIFYFFIETALWTAQFKSVTAPLKIESVVEEPVMLGDVQIGLRVTANVRLPKPVALNRYGAVVLEALHSQMVAVEMSGSNRTAPFYYDGLPQVTRFNGVLVEDLPEVKAFRTQPYGRTPDGKTALPAGIYQVSKVYWLQGLRRSNEKEWREADPIPCKIEWAADSLAAKDAAIQNQHALEASGKPMFINMGDRLSLRDRNGYRYFNLTAPLQYRFNQTQWQSTLAALPIASCTIADEQVKAAEAAQAAVKKAQDDQRAYDDGSINYQDNPLYQDACAHNLAKVTARIATEKPVDGVWVPHFSLAPIINECAIQKPNIELFKLLIPSLYARQQKAVAESEREYCDVLRELHIHRQAAFLQAMGEMNMPLDCNNRQLWRLGIAPIIDDTLPYDYGPNEPVARHLAASKRKDDVAWLKILIANKIDICQPSRVRHYSDSDEKIDGETLLEEIVPHYSLDLIAAVLDAGCDPHQAGHDVEASPWSFEKKLSPAVWWQYRRTRNEHDATTSPVTTHNSAQLRKLDKLMNVADSELKRPRTE